MPGASPPCGRGRAPRRRCCDSLPRPRSSQLTMCLGCSASERPSHGSRSSKFTNVIGCSARCAPTAGASTTTSMPISRRWSAAPMPESCSRCGVLNAPPLTTMSPRLAICSTRPLRSTSTPTARPSRMTRRCTSACERTVRLLRRRAGSRYPRAAAPAPAVERRRRRDLDALEDGTAQVLGAGDARGDGGLDEGRRRGVRRVDAADAHRAAAPVIVVGEEVVLDAQEERQHVVPRPARDAPAVVVEVAAAHPQHRVHRAAAADELPARLVQAAAVASRLGLGVVVPVAALVEQAGKPGRRASLQAPVRPTGFEQQDVACRVLAEAGGDGAARRPGADDDVIVGLHRAIVACPPPPHAGGSHKPARSALWQPRCRHPRGVAHAG